MIEQHTGRAPIRYLEDHQIPAWLKECPNFLLDFRGRGRGFRDFEAWLGQREFPRPTLLELESERRRRR